MKLVVLPLATAATVLLAAAAATANSSPLHSCARAPGEGRLAVSTHPGPGCDGAWILARVINEAAKRRFPHSLPRHYTVDTRSPPADASPATFRFRCVVSSRVVQSKRVGHPVRETSARCANGVGSRFRYSFSVA
jgi:hypothetical protein